MSGEMSGANWFLCVEKTPSNFATRRIREELDLCGVRLYSPRRQPVACPPKEADMDRLISFKELQEILGVSKSTARRWTKRHKVNPIGIMGCIRFWHSEVIAAIETQRGVIR